MTMPHLMNCPHSEDGWCLACVKTLHDDSEKRERFLTAALVTVGSDMSIETARLRQGGRIDFETMDAWKLLIEAVVTKSITVGG